MKVQWRGCSNSKTTSWSTWFLHTDGVTYILSFSRFPQSHMFILHALGQIKAVVCTRKQRIDEASKLRRWGKWWRTEFGEEMGTSLPPIPLSSITLCTVLISTHRLSVGRCLTTTSGKRPSPLHVPKMVELCLAYFGLNLKFKLVFKSSLAITSWSSGSNLKILPK